MFIFIMTILLILSIIPISALFKNKILTFILILITIIIVFITASSDPLRMDKGMLKFTSDDHVKLTSIEKFDNYVKDLLDGADNETTINSTLLNKNIVINGYVRIEEIEKNSGGFMIKFTDSNLMDDVTYTLLFYLEGNEELANKKKGDIIFLSGKFNSVSFDDYDGIGNVTFKECEVLK